MDDLKKITTKRWLYVFLGMLIYLCLGSVYSWSVFRKPLEVELGISFQQSGFPYTFFLLFFALFVFLSGKFVDSLSPKYILIIGGILVGSGWFLSGIVKNIFAITFFYGIVSGSGVGICYGVPISVASKWFPDKKGLAMGLTILGFGLSPLITAPLAKALILSLGILETFKLLGLIFGSIIILLSFVLKKPDNLIAEKLISHATKTIVAKNNTLSKSYTLTEALKKKNFYGIWLIFFIGTSIGLTAIGMSSSYAQEQIKLDPKTAALTVSIFAIFNGLGRPFFGYITDKIKPNGAALLNYSIIILSCAILFFAEENQVSKYLLGFSLLWFCLGGWLAIAPTATASFFGSEHFSQIYGAIYLAYGIGSFVGNFSASILKETFNNYGHIFILFSLLAVLGILISRVFLYDFKDSSKENAI